MWYLHSVPHRLSLSHIMAASPAQQKPFPLHFSMSDFASIEVNGKSPTVFKCRGIRYSERLATLFVLSSAWKSNFALNFFWSLRKLKLYLFSPDYFCSLMLHISVILLVRWNVLFLFYVLAHGVILLSQKTRNLFPCDEILLLFFKSLQPFHGPRLLLIKVIMTGHT